ncbi:MAG: hypothetical protein AVDCRST_MAG25-2698, partial [uncultured Rubrobacteraceae bacterium]
DQRGDREGLRGEGVGDPLQGRQRDLLDPERPGDDRRGRPWRRYGPAGSPAEVLHRRLALDRWSERRSTPSRLRSLRRRTGRGDGDRPHTHPSTGGAAPRKARRRGTFGRESGPGV